MRSKQTMRIALQMVAVLAAMTAGAIWIVYNVDLFPDAPGMPAYHGVELDEAFAVAVFFCVGLLAIVVRLFLLSRHEVARRVKAEHEAREIALQDALTGLANRRRFDQELKAATDALPRRGGAHAVLLVDLNEFKRVNDVYGHNIGDEVLINVAARLQRAVREGDIVARFGGDEFVVLARQLVSPEEATSIAMRMVDAFSQPVVTGALRHQIGAGIGIALVPQNGTSPSEIVRKADIALYRAKVEKPRSVWRFFEPEMDARIREREFMEREVRAAIHNGSIVPYYQPVIDLKTKKVVGFEALARWTHPDLGAVPPDRFIPIAESCGLLAELTDHLLRLAVHAASAWPADFILSFNVSPSQLKDQTLAARVLAILGESSFPTSRLEVEVTESALVRDFEGAQDVLGALRAAGVRIALDDFGTGYSSLYHLRNFKVDKIKIDHSFVAALESEPEQRVLVGALLGLGHGLGVTVLAEGVEKPAQANTLLAQGCEQAQGYLYGAAMSAAETLDLLRKSGPRVA